jgi:nucleoside-diphosphate-sugar epimerase
MRATGQASSLAKPIAAPTRTQFRSRHGRAAVRQRLRTGVRAQGERGREIHPTRACGAQTRDFIYIDDLTRAIERACVADGVAGEVFQIATARETTVGELATALSTAMAAEGFARPPLEFLDRRPGEVLRNFADTRKAADLLEWSARVSLSEGLRRTVRWAAQAAKELPTVS